MTEQKIQLDGDEVVFTAKDGRELKVREVIEWNNAASQWTPPEGVEIPEEAQKLYEEGREHGMKQQRDEALAAFRKAAEMVPQWPHPRHDIAFVHLLTGEWGDALAMFKEVEAMEPKGFFNAKTAIWALEKEGNQELPQGIYRAYAQVGWIQEPQQRAQELHKMVSAAPGFAPAWKDLAGFVQDPGQAQQVLNNGIAAEPDADTLGGLLANLAMVYLACGQTDEAMEMLGHMTMDESGSRAARSLCAQALLRVHLAKKGIQPQQMAQQMAQQMPQPGGDAADAGAGSPPAGQ